MVGRPYGILPKAWNFREALEDKYAKATDPAVWEALEVPRTTQDAAAHAAYIDACVATVELLTAVAPVCYATINATYTRRVGAHLYRYTPLHLGARFDRLPMLRVLLDRGADPSVPVPHTSHSAFTSVFASVHRLCSLQSYMEIGHWASGFPAEETYSAVVQSIDERIGEGMTALLRDLLGPQASLADRVNEVNTTDKDGNTALHWAMGYSLVYATEALLALGAREDAQNLVGEVPAEGTLPTTTRGNDHQRKYD
ncbi:Palmitoyltransferase zdhhc13 [Sporothrix eucalyptigena]